MPYELLNADSPFAIISPPVISMLLDSMPHEVVDVAVTPFAVTFPPLILMPVFAYMAYEELPVPLVTITSPPLISMVKTDIPNEMLSVDVPLVTMSLPGPVMTRLLAAEIPWELRSPLKVDVNSAVLPSAIAIVKSPLTTRKTSAAGVIHWKSSVNVRMLSSGL